MAVKVNEILGPSCPPKTRRCLLWNGLSK